MKITNNILDENPYNNLWLAPMAGITDSAFRQITKKFGSTFVITEMISASGLFYNNERTKNYLKIKKEEKPISVQIFGHDPNIMTKISYEIQNCGCQMIDINMGCPAPKIVKNGDGCSLMKDEALASEIVKEVSKNLDIPLSVKIRKGWDETTDTIQFAKKLEDSGASLVIIHPRTRGQFYSGASDWNVIKKLKKELSIPVIANGDIIDENTAKKAFESTNCDGIMIGRAARGNPFIFERISHYLEYEKKIEPVNIEKKINIMKEHLKLILETDGEKAIKSFRKHFFWYIKGKKISEECRNLINKMNTFEDFERIIYDFKSDWSD